MTDCRCLTSAQAVKLALVDEAMPACPLHDADPAPALNSAELTAGIVAAFGATFADPSTPLDAA